MAVFKLTEFQGCSGKWYTTCEELLGQPGPHWHIPARILNISLDEFVKLLINKYEVKDISYNPENKFLLYSWDNQAKMRVYKNYINAQARKVNFQVGE